MELAEARLPEGHTLRYTPKRSVSERIMLTYLSREINHVVGPKNDKVILEGYIP